MSDRISRLRRSALALIAAGPLLWGIQSSQAADLYDEAVQHTGRSADDLKRDPLDHPAEVLRLSGVKPGMKVADFMAADGYYSELLSYVVGPKGHVLLINNPSFDRWSNNAWAQRLEHDRLPNVEHQTVDLNKMELPAGSLDAVFLIKVYHDLYWVDTNQANWPKFNTAVVVDELVKALKPNGTLVVVDHSAKAGTGSSDASTLHRIEEAYTVKDFQQRGMKLVTSSDVLRIPSDPKTQISYKGPALGKTDRFVLVFRKKGG